MIMQSSRLDPVDSIEDQSLWGRGVSLQEILVAIRRRWWAVAAVLVVVVAIAAWHTMRQPRLYSAAATVRIQQQQAPIAGMPGMGPTYDYRVDRLLSEQQVIRSQNVAERVVDSLGLRLRIAQPAGLLWSDVFGDARPRVAASVRDGDYTLHLGDRDYSLRAGHITYGTARYGDTLVAAGMRLLLPARPAIDDRDLVLSVIPENWAAREVQGGIGTRVLPQTDIVEISYTGTDPALVRDIANAVARTYAQFSLEGQQASARGQSQFILKALDEQSRALAQAQDSLKRFQEEHQTSDVSAEAAALFDNIHRFEVERQDLVAEQAVYQTIVGTSGPADTSDKALQRLVGTEAITKNTNIGNLYQRWFDLVKRRQELLGQFLPQYPEVKAVDSLITRTKQDLQAASRLYLQNIAVRLNSLDQSIASLRQQTEQFPPLVAEQARLKANVQTVQNTYDQLQAQLQVARINESAENGNVRLIDQAMMPTYAVSPNRRRALMMATFFGLLLGIGFAVLLEKLDTSVRSPDELSERYGLPVLGMIPAIRDETGSRSDDSVLGRLVTHADPRSPVAEAYRSLRTNLAFARATQQIRSIVLTSPGPADGKSTTVANLAITFAQQGQRTLIVDADLRRAVMDRTFDVPRSPGLTEVIVDQATLDEAVRPTAVPNLFVLPSGHFPPNPSELLGSDAMRHLLEELASRFDIVLFDSPPLLAVTDAAVLSTMVDGTIVVVRMGNTAREAVRRALMQLQAVHARMLGGVLNDVDLRHGSYYGGYGYYYYAYYGGDERGNGQHTRVLDRIRALSGHGAGRNGG